VFGTGQPAVVIEPGFGGSAQSWRAIAEELAEDTNVVTYDRAPYGASSPAVDGRTPREIARDLHGVLEALGITGPGAGRPLIRRSLRPGVRRPVRRAGREQDTSSPVVASVARPSPGPGATVCQPPSPHGGVPWPLHPLRRSRARHSGHPGRAAHRTDEHAAGAGGGNLNLAPSSPRCARSHGANDGNRARAISWGSLSREPRAACQDADLRHSGRPHRERRSTAAEQGWASALPPGSICLS
jgi:hypothetical protein